MDDLEYQAIHTRLVEWLYLKRYGPNGHNPASEKQMALLESDENLTKCQASYAIDKILGTNDI
jgi:hypothetical protein